MSVIINVLVRRIHGSGEKTQLEQVEIDGPVPAGAVSIRWVATNQRDWVESDVLVNWLTEHIGRESEAKREAP